MSARVSQKVATKTSFRVRNTQKFKFLEYFSKAKREECNQNTELSAINFASMKLHFSTNRSTCFTESSHQSFFRGKKLLKLTTKTIKNY